MEKYLLWNSAPSSYDEAPTITAYIPQERKSKAAIVIFPGGGYGFRADHEGEGYAHFFNEQGICAFVCDYRVSPHRFPLPLLDARRAVRWVRYHADKYSIDKDKIVVIGSSAGGHLAALVSTYFEGLAFEGVDDVDKEDFIPNAQILCYPVIKLSVDNTLTHIDSCINFLGMEQLRLAHDLTPQNCISDRTPPCFIWHTMEDEAVPVGNSLDYAAALQKQNIPCELHLFPHGGHGWGLSREDNEAARHVSSWTNMLMNWLCYIGVCQR